MNFSGKQFIRFVEAARRRWLIELGLVVLLTVAGCGATVRRPVQLDRGVVACPEPNAARVGADILRLGGNAVDAAIAVQFALAVTYPTAGNIGGGGFMLIHDPRANGSPGHEFALDYRETAPAKAGREMYLDSAGDVIPKLSLESHMAAGVPGTVKGMWEAHRRFGRLAWRDLVAPAVRLADEGFVLDAWTAASFAEQAAEVEKRTARFRDACNFSRYFHGVAGERLRQPELAASLRRISETGPRGFYEGLTATLIVEEMKRGGGLITGEDLKSYSVKWRAPIEFTYRDHRVVSMPPPSSGGIALVQLLSMFGQFERPAWGTVQHLHLVAEIEKRVFADRSVYGGDPDFVAVPVKELTDSAYCKRRAAEVNQAARTDPAAIGAGTFPGFLPHARSQEESTQTTHFSIVDRDGMAVANTTTLNGGYGSGIVVSGAGFLLNNEMDDFSAKPGARNMYGVTGGEANSIAPGKRMLSSMTPTFVFRPDGALWLVLGSPGGPTIFTTVFQVVTNKVDFGMPLQEAVDAARFHHQWPPPQGSDPIKMESSQGHPFEEGVEQALLGKGYSIKRVQEIGDVQAIEIDGRRAIGASDRRGIGRVERE